MPNHREAALDIDAEQADRLAVAHAGADHHAVGGELQEGEDDADDREREEEIDQAPPRIGDRVTQPRSMPTCAVPEKAAGAACGIGFAP